jgi:hypothetical protein
LSGISKEVKLAMLRAKTDRELSILIRKELVRGMSLANVAAAKGSPSHAQAERAFDKAKALLPAIQNLRPTDRSKLEAALNELRGTLDALPQRSALQYGAGSGSGD